MRVGVTGHQERPGIDWSWVAYAVRTELSKTSGVTKALSSLAAGSDQVFADVALKLGIPVLAVIPLDNYETYFHGQSLVEYCRLLPQCETVRLSCKGDPERAFFEAGRFVVENSDLLFAIWDGAAALGLGGTADIVQYAQSSWKKIVRIDPIRRQVASDMKKEDTR